MIRRWLSVAGSAALLAWSFVVAAQPCGPDALPEFERIAPGHYLRIGRHEAMQAANCGAIANSGFIVGERSVALVDPGGSLLDGLALREAVAGVTALPISHVIVSHAHPDHYFGLAAFGADVFAGDLPELVMHAHLQRALAQRDDAYRQRFADLLPASGSVLQIPFPRRVVRAGEAIDLGGRRLAFLPMPVAHTDSDLAVLDAEAGVLWAGDLLFETRLPSLDGSLSGWLAVLGELAGTAPALVVPGHGHPGSWAAVATPQTHYLEQLRSRTRDALARRVPLADWVAWPPPDADAAQRARGDWQSHWLLFDAQHPVNLGRAYTELEWE